MAGTSPAMTSLTQPTTSSLLDFGFEFQTATTLTVIASEAKQSIAAPRKKMDCFVACSSPRCERSLPDMLAGNSGPWLPHRWMHQLDERWMVVLQREVQDDC
jgi:hypothetical protein